MRAEHRRIWRTTAPLSAIVIAVALVLGGQAGGVTSVAAGDLSTKQVSNAMGMRADFGLRADRSYVEGLAGSTKDAGSHEFGFPLTASEVADLDLYGRSRFSINVGRDVVPFLEKQSEYAGEWIDQANGGKLVVMLTRGNEALKAKVRSKMPAKSYGVRFEVVESSYDELLDALDRAPAVAKELMPSARFSIGEVNIPDNRLDLVFKTDSAAAVKANEGALEQRLGVDVKLSTGELTRQVENCGVGSSVFKCHGPIRAGVRIFWKNYSSGWPCTMGFHIVKNGVPEWLTAGHCRYNSTSDIWKHHASFHNDKKVGTKQQSLYNPTNKIDAVRVSHRFDSEASGRIFGTGTPWQMKDEVWPQVGDWVYAFGYKTMDQDRKPTGGRVKSKDATWYSERKGITVKGATMSNFDPIPGDSGGPVYKKTSSGGTAQFWPVGIVNDDVLAADNEPGKCAFAKVAKVLQIMNADIYKD